MEKNINVRLLIYDKIRRNEKFFSVEIVPEQNDKTLRSWLSQMTTCCPLFYSVTCHDGNVLTLKMAEKMVNNVLLHVTTAGLTSISAEDFLNRALADGRTNLFVIRGSSSHNGDFMYAKDLVTFIRNRFGSKFCICVAGYPETHPDAISRDSDLCYLKAKVDAGADFVITQFFFESSIFVNFVKDCRKLGITVPILPGLLPFTNAKILHKMARKCCVNVPVAVLNDLELISDNDEAVREYGVNLTVKIIQDIFHNDAANGYHLFILNEFSAAKEIYNRLHLPSKYKQGYL